MLPSSPGESLRAAYLQKVARNRAYSLRAFARDLGLSHSHLSRVLRGRARLSVAQAYAIEKQLALGEAFVNDVTRELGAKEKREAPERVAPLRVEVARFRVVSEWYHTAILVMAASGDTKLDPKLLGKRLGVPPREVRKALTRLAAAGLLAKKGSEWEVKSRHLMIPAQERATAVRAFHEQMIEKAAKAIKRPSAERDISGTTFSFDPAKLPELRKRIAAFRRSISRLSTDGGEVFQINVQVFPLTRSDR